MRPPRRLLDISVSLCDDTPVYPGDPPVEIGRALSRGAGAAANVSCVCLGVHSGTHVDAPFHVDDDWPPLGEEHLPVLVGPARVVELATGRDITTADLAALNWLGVERVLFRTGNSALWNGRFREDYVGLTLDAAEYLTKTTDVRLVGIDYLSIESPASSDLMSHRTLLGNGVLVLEGLNLSGIAPGDYYLVCLPLRLATPDGAPARALLLEL